MTKEIEAVAINQEVGLSTEHIEVTPYGVEFDYDHKPSIAEWLEVVNKVQRVHGMTQFYLGDLVAYADVPETSGWGESKYADLVEATGYEFQTLRQYASLARRFPIDIRKAIKDVDSNLHVSYMHFRIVAPLDNVHALYFLERVAEGKWTVNRLREEVAREQGKNVVDAEVEEDGQYVQTLAQRMTTAWKNIRNFAKENEAELIRIQVVKNGHVVEEELVEL